MVLFLFAPALYAKENAKRVLFGRNRFIFKTFSIPGIQIVLKSFNLCIGVNKVFFSLGIDLSSISCQLKNNLDKKSFMIIQDLL